MVFSKCSMSDMEHNEKTCMNPYNAYGSRYFVDFIQVIVITLQVLLALR